LDSRTGHADTAHRTAQSVGTIAWEVLVRPEIEIRFPTNELPL
jgi:hypothetical protein